MNLLAVWLINAVSLLLLTYLMPSIKVENFTTALVIALVLGLVNVLIRPVLLILTLPVNLLTLGLFTLVINGFCFWLVAEVVKGFSVPGFGSAIIGALVYSLIAWAASAMLLGKD
ncbi:phage holin family protein [Chitinimonas arctica]|uniref:Phage holin family protein n=1 Tax=Chitinimonas arctica TaxID=2594795 RepID=A0A516SD40_9NEIS|nr:phage holin family protein [Chitinimonas arctica]QDQ26050.1 phage holin family protein [Chitinimonas arctica]